MDDKNDMEKMPPRITNAQLWWGQQQTLNLMRDTAKRVSALELAMHDSERDRKGMREELDTLKGFVKESQDSRKILQQLRAFIITAIPAAPLIVAIGHHFSIW